MTGSRRQKAEVRSQSGVLQAKTKKKQARGWSTAGLVVFFVFVGFLLIAQSSLLIAANEPARPEGKKAEAKAEVKTEEKRKGEIAEKEESLRKEEERLKLLKKELDEKIDKYTKLLARMEEVLKSMDTARGERYEHLIKAYEAMPNEEAAARLSALEEMTAMNILMRMKSKKAGAVMAAMDAKKAASLTEGMMGMAKKFPTK
ncbi:MAG: hypothetical protein HZB31_14995 [Nitrospirae bacterium]|nr:hypothetical protein [Nitrospirota bacterium]